MPTLRDLKRRIRSIRSTAQVTKAMEMVSAAKLRRSQERLYAARPYGKRLSQLLAHLGHSAGMANVPLFEVRQVKTQTVVAIASDRGLCGSYNTSVLRALAGVADGCKPGVSLEVVAVGKRVRDFAAKQAMRVVRADVGLPGYATFDHARDLTAFLIDRFLSRETDEVLLLFTSFKTAMSHALTTRVLLPVARSEAEVKSVPLRDYIFEPSRERLIEALLPCAVAGFLYLALAESFASEHGARMIAMGAATKNAFDLIDALTLRMNRARQQSITRELADIVGGAEVMKQ